MELYRIPQEAVTNEFSRYDMFLILLPSFREGFFLTFEPLTEISMYMFPLFGYVPSFLFSLTEILRVNYLTTGTS